MGGILIAVVGVASLDTGLGVDFATADGAGRTAFALIGIGVAAELLSFAVPGGAPPDDEC